MIADERDPQTYAIIGAAMEVHNTLSYGFAEAVYHEALMLEFERAGIPFRRECALPINYKGTVLNCGYRADFVCYDEVLIEIKALSRLSGTEDGQVLNYFRASGLEKALLINFGTTKLEYKRFRR